MSQARDKAQGLTKQIIGQMLGDQLLVQEGNEQEHTANKPREAGSDTSRRARNHSSGQLTASPSRAGTLT